MPQTSLGLSRGPWTNNARPGGPGRALRRGAGLGWLYAVRSAGEGPVIASHLNVEDADGLPGPRAPVEDAARHPGMLVKAALSARIGVGPVDTRSPARSAQVRSVGSATAMRSISCEGRPCCEAVRLEAGGPAFPHPPLRGRAAIRQVRTGSIAALARSATPSLKGGTGQRPTARRNGLGLGRHFRDPARRPRAAIRSRTIADKRVFARRSGATQPWSRILLTAQLQRASLLSNHPRLSLIPSPHDGCEERWIRASAAKRYS